MIYQVLKLLKPVVRWVGTVMFRTRVPKIDGKIYREIEEKIKDFDIILSSTDGQLSNLINISKIRHGCVNVGKLFNKYPDVSEMLGRGHKLTDLITHLMRKDVVIILRYKNNINTSKMIEFIKKNMSAEYDFEFEFNDDQYYCFEWIAKMFLEGSNIKNIKKISKFGYKYYDYSSFLEDERFQIIYDSRDLK